MQVSVISPSGGIPRRLVLGTAFAIGLLLALAPRTAAVFAADGPALVVAQADTPRTAPSPAGMAADAKSSAGKDGNASSSTPAVPIPPVPPIPGATSPDTSSADEDADTETDATTKGRVTVENHGIVIEKGRKRVRVEGLGRDREYDSFEQFVQDAPWLAGLVFLVVLLVFLVPLLIIALLIWYKIRKNRMANETMLKLAERGVVTTTAAMDAVASGAAVPMADAATSGPAAIPAYEHARALQRRTVWSDLRKGVMLTGIGLGLIAFSMFDDGTPNSVGLVCLFVGAGYCLLWYFEDRHRLPQRNATTTPTPPGGA
ncbi:MAG TPA: DUF6249 domain-containing protein [Casimicrobiaceae bacterium]|nr:DUF6249 domain-containing protein [Casimicrobiaceae bacterium]